MITAVDQSFCRLGIVKPTRSSDLSERRECNLVQQSMVSRNFQIPRMRIRSLTRLSYSLGSPMSQML
jgi:hypothetical protein